MANPRSSALLAMMVGMPITTFSVVRLSGHRYRLGGK